MDGWTNGWMQGWGVCCNTGEHKPGWICHNSQGVHRRMGHVRSPTNGQGVSDHHRRTGHLRLPQTDRASQTTKDVVPQTTTDGQHLRPPQIDGVSQTPTEGQTSTGGQGASDHERWMEHLRPPQMDRASQRAFRSQLCRVKVPGQDAGSVPAWGESSSWPVELPSHWLPIW